MSDKVSKYSFSLIYSNISINGIAKKKYRSNFIGLGNIYVSRLLSLIKTAFNDEAPVRVEVEVIKEIPAPEEIKPKYITLIHDLEASKNALVLGAIETTDVEINIPSGKVGVMIALDAREVAVNDVRKIKIYLASMSK